MRVRSLAHDDVPGAVRMLRASFPASLARYFTRTQHGAEALYHAMLDNARLFPGAELTVAADELDSSLGFAEWASSADGAHLSYICTDLRARRAGVATLLIRAFVESRQPSVVSLDVFADNRPAIQLYRSLGFAVQSESLWLTRQLPPPSGAAVRVGNALEAIAMQRLFGFSAFQVTYEHRSAKVGLLGTEVLRCFDLNDFTDDGLLAAMHASAPSAVEALVVADSLQPGPTGPEVNVLVRSLRMTHPNPRELAS